LLPEFFRIGGGIRLPIRGPEAAAPGFYSRVPKAATASSTVSFPLLTCHPARRTWASAASMSPSFAGLMIRSVLSSPKAE